MRLKVKDFIERLLALKVTPEEHIAYAKDPYNIFGEDLSQRKPMQVATTAALLIHLLLFLIVFPAYRDKLFIPTEQVIMLRNLARPGLVGGGGGTPKAAPPKPVVKPVTSTATLVPIPDPTPHAPEPIRKVEIEVAEVVKEITPELNIGDITAPPGPAGRGGDSAGPGEAGGSGGGRGGGEGNREGVYTMGSGIVDPVLLQKTTPSYTDEAIRAKIQGVVFLQAVIRKDGRVDSFRVLRGLGYGLEEKAILEIAAKWKFRPGTYNGKPVDVLAHIEVQFNLR